MTTLHIQLLGDFRLSLEDELLTTIHHPRQQALLAYLLLHRHAPQSRHHLAFLFWPDTSESQAFANLRNLLFRLRRGLPEQDRLLVADSQTVQWRPDTPYTLDVAAFETAAAQASTATDLEKAVALYRGDLLPSCYDDWILPERDRLRQTVMGLLERLIGLLEVQRNLHAATAYAGRLLQFDPLNESTFRTLIRLHAADNDRASALRVYHTCVRRLRDELGVDPSAETQAIYRRLLSMEAAPAATEWATPAQPPLVGRQAEWAQLLGAWREAAGGKCQLLLLAGEAGIGKTRLATELLAWVSRQGLAGAEAHCYAAEGALPYAPIAAWLRAPSVQKRLATLDAIWLREVARLTPELMAVPQTSPYPEQPAEKWQRQRLFEALARTMTTQGEPLLLLLNDLQWCDSDTLEWLHFLLRFDPTARLLIVGTVRSEDVLPDHPLHVLLAALRRQEQLTEVTLDGLDAADTAKLAAHLAQQSLTAHQQARLHQETEGNPLFVVEMMRAGLEFGDAQASVAIWQAVDAQLPAQPRFLPPRIHAVLASRLAQLSENARDLAGLAATIGREFSFPVLVAASDLADSALVRNLDELWQRRIIQEHGGAVYDFTHDKLREVAYTTLSAARRHLLHRRIVEALETVYQQMPDAMCGQAATQYDLAGLYAQAIPYYWRAAQAAQRVYANADAIRYDRRALTLLEGPVPQAPALAASLYEHLGDMLHFTGQYEAARAALQRGADIMPETQWIDRARLLRKLGNTWREQYLYADAEQCYAASERILEQAPIDKSAAWWQAWIQTALETNLAFYWQGRVAESDALRLRLQPAIAQHGAPEQRAVYFQETAWIEFRRNRSVATPEIVALTEAALDAHLEADNLAGIPAAHFAVGFLRLWNGEPQASLEPLQCALRLAEQSGDVSLQARCLAYLTVAHRQCRQVQEVRQIIVPSLDVAAAAHMPEYVAMATANQAWLAWLEGEYIRTQELAQAALALWAQLPAGHASAPFQWLALWPLMATALHAAQGALAINTAQRLIDPSQQRLPDDLTGSLEQAAQDWAEGATEAALALLDQVLALAQQARYL